MTIPKLSPYKLHVLNWKNCTRCPAHQHRKNVVIARGTVPCDILFVGEAPGESEDVIGDPFVGKAGKFFDKLLANVIPPEYTTCFINLVGCIPRDDGKGKASEPSEEALKACKPRVEDMIQIAKPSLIVGVGKHSETWLDQKLRGSIQFDAKIPIIFIYHPSFILRSNPAQQGYLIKRCEVLVAKGIEEHLEVRNAPSNAKGS